MRRIDNQDVLNYAKNLSNRKSNQPKLSDNTKFKQIYNLNTYNNNNKSSRQSMQMKTHREKFTRTQNSRKHQTAIFMNQSLSLEQNNNETQNKDKQKILLIYQKINSIYNKLLQLYKQNQTKLAFILNKHIKQQIYIYTKQLFIVIRCSRLKNQLSQKILQHSHPQKLHHEMTKFHQFLQNFYQQKCLHHIQITQESILQRQLAIRNHTSKDRYKMITKSFCPKLITNQIDIVQEFKLMNVENTKKLDRVQCEVFKRLKSSQGKIGKVFAAVCEEKENDLFEGRNIINVIR